MKRAMSDNLTQRGMIVMASSMWQLKTKYQTHENQDYAFNGRTLLFAAC